MDEEYKNSENIIKFPENESERAYYLMNRKSQLNVQNPILPIFYVGAGLIFAYLSFKCLEKALNF